MFGLLVAQFSMRQLEFNFVVEGEQSNIWSNTFMLGKGQLHPVRKEWMECLNYASV